MFEIIFIDPTAQFNVANYPQKDGGWVVGNCNFNEKPVVNLDLDFDIGFVNYHESTNLI